MRVYVTGVSEFSVYFVSSLPAPGPYPVEYMCTRDCGLEHDGPSLA